MLQGKRNYLYVYEKLVGSGFALTIFMGFIFLFINDNLFELSEMLASPWVWVAFYGYAVICSIIIDVVGKRWPRLKRWNLLFYMFAGFIVFAFVMFHLIYMLIAGTIGAIVAMIYYVGVREIAKRKWVGTVFALIPLLFIWMAFTDFTQKENWVEKRDSESFVATYSYFDGEHPIPVQLEEGERIVFSVEFETNGGHGFRFENEKGDYLPMEEVGDKLAFQAVEAGEYEIVVHGSEAEGRLTVSWDIDQNS